MDLNQNKNVTSTLKILFLGFLSLIFLVIDWVLIEKALYTDKTLLFWIWPALSIAVSIAILTLFAAVNNNRLYAWGFGGLSFLTYVLIFPKDWFVIAGGLAFLGLLFWFEQRIRDEEKSRQNFSIRQVSYACTNVIIYGFLLLLGLNIYYNTSADFKANPEGFYEALGRSAAKSTRYLSGGEGSRLDLNQTLDQYLETETRKLVPNYDSVPEDFRRQYLDQTRDQFFRQFSISIPTDRPISEIIATFAVERVRDAAEKYQILFPLIFTVIILALLRTFSFLLRWTALLLTWAVYKLLLMTGFFRLEKVTVEVEKLSI